MKHFFFILALFFAIAQSTAQTKGTITYKMDFSSDNPDMAMALPMMQGSTMEISFVPEKSRASVKMGMIMTMNTITDAKTKKGLLLMEMMGSKNATFIDLSKDDKDSQANYTVEKTAPEFKNILGFKCKKFVLKDEAGSEFVIWATTDLKIPTKGIEQLSQFSVDGFPLEFTLDSNGMKAYFLATNFDKNVDESIFKMDVPEGYTVLTEEELENMGQ